MKTIKKKGKGTSRAIAVAQRLPLYATEEEVSEINRKHEFIHESLRKSLPTAIEIGEWFLKKKEPVGHGNWILWLNSYFPKIPHHTVALYMMFADEKRFLLAKYGDQMSTDRHLSVDFERVPSINDARKAIVAKRKAEKGSRSKSFDVESEVVSHEGNGEAHRPIRITPPVEKQVELEEEGTAFETEDRPEEIIQSAIRTAGLHLRSALLDYQAAVNVAKQYGISDKLIREGIEGIFNDLSDLLSPQDELKRQLRNLLK